MYQMPFLFQQCPSSEGNSKHSSINPNCEKRSHRLSIKSNADLYSGVRRKRIRSASWRRLDEEVPYSTSNGSVFSLPILPTRNKGLIQHRKNIENLAPFWRIPTPVTCGGLGRITKSGRCRFVRPVTLVIGQNNAFFSDTNSSPTFTGLTVTLKRKRNTLHHNLLHKTYKNIILRQIWPKYQWPYGKGSHVAVAYKEHSALGFVQDALLVSLNLECYKMKSSLQTKKVVQSKVHNFHVVLHKTRK